MLDALAAARRALLTAGTTMPLGRRALLGEQLDQLGHELRRLHRHSLHARSTPATIRELTLTLPVMAERVRALHRQITPKPAGKAGDESEESEQEASPLAHPQANQTDKIKLR